MAAPIHRVHQIQNSVQATQGKGRHAFAATMAPGVLYPAKARACRAAAEPGDRAAERGGLNGSAGGGDGCSGAQPAVDIGLARGQPRAHPRGTPAHPTRQGRWGGRDSQHTATRLGKKGGAAWESHARGSPPAYEEAGGGVYPPPASRFAGSAQPTTLAPRFPIPGTYVDRVRRGRRVDWRHQPARPVGAASRVGAPCGATRRPLMRATSR